MIDEPISGQENPQSVGFGMRYDASPQVFNAPQQQYQAEPPPPPNRRDVMLYLSKQIQAVQDRLDQTATSCKDSMEHTSSCKLCSYYYKGEMKLYQIVIITLIIVLIYLRRK